MSSEETPPTENVDEVNPSARLLSELAEMSRSHFLISRRQQGSQSLPRANPSLGQSLQKSHVSTGKAPIHGGVGLSHASQPSLQAPGSYWNSNNAQIAPDLLLSYPNEQSKKLHQLQLERHQDRRQDHQVGSPTGPEQVLATNSPHESPRSGNSVAVGGIPSPGMPSKSGSPSVLSSASPSAHEPEKPGEGIIGASSGSSSNAQFASFMDIHPAAPNVGQTEIDRLMLLVQAQGRGSASPAENRIREAPYSLPSASGSTYGPIHPNQSSSQSPSDTNGGSQSDPHSVSHSASHSDSHSDSNSAHSDSHSASISPASGVGTPAHTNSGSVNTASSPQSNSASHTAQHSKSHAAHSASHSASEYHFPCTYQGCTKRFKQRAHLHTHLRSHTGERPYVCPFQGCRKWFSQRCNLRTHIRSHTGERPYKCEICGKAFSQQGNMRHHLLIHYNEHPLICKIENCNKTFNQLGNLKAHQNAAHRSTVHAFTLKLQSGLKLEDLPEEEREMFEYFCELYKNSNRGIRGRGKGTKTIVYRGGSREPSDRFIPEFILREQTYEAQQKQVDQHLAKPQLVQQEQQVQQAQQAQAQYPQYSHHQLSSESQLQQPPQMPSQAYNAYPLSHQQLLNQQMGQQMGQQISQQMGQQMGQQVGHISQQMGQMGQPINQPMGQPISQAGQMNQHSQQATHIGQQVHQPNSQVNPQASQPVGQPAQHIGQMGQQVGQPVGPPVNQQVNQQASQQSRQHMGQQVDQQIYHDRYQDISVDLMPPPTQQYPYSYHMPLQQIQQPVPYPLYTYQQPVPDAQIDPVTGVSLYPPKED